MARRRYKRLGANAVLAAGLFVAFGAALFVGMYFLYGKLGRTWRGVAEVRVLFAQVKSLQPGAPVLYDGMELGRVKEVRLVHATSDLLKNLRPLDKSDLTNLPLNDRERERIARLPDSEVDAAARKAIDGQVIVLAVMDLLIEHDDKRLREDDAYRVATSVLGESSIELVTGRGKAIVPEPGMMVLGVSADVISDIGRNMAQIQEIMQSMADIVGGETGRGMIHNQLRNFDEFTASFDQQAASIQKKVPEIWDNIDTRADRSEANMNDVTAKLIALKPQVEEGVVKANKSIASVRNSLAKSAEAGLESLNRYRSKGKEEVERWHKASQEYRETTPAALKDLRKTAEGALSAADKLDAMLERFEIQLKLGVESGRESLNQQTASAMELQEQAWQFKKSTGYFSSKYTPQQLAQRHMAWRYEMALAQYKELRRELSAIQDSMSTGDPADQERARHVDQLLSESDSFFGVSRGQFASKRREQTSPPSTEVRAEVAPLPTTRAPRNSEGGKP